MCCPNECSQTSCPFAFTDESEQIQNYGCLPEPLEIVHMRVNHNKTWACHSDPTKPCLGAIEYLKKYNKPYKVIDKDLVKEVDDWNIYLEDLTIDIKHELYSSHIMSHDAIKDLE